MRACLCFCVCAPAVAGGGGGDDVLDRGVRVARAYAEEALDGHCRRSPVLLQIYTRMVGEYISIGVGYQMICCMHKALSCYGCFEVTHFLCMVLVIINY